MKDRRIEQHPFEFILKINGNIICQRYFPINNFNPDVLDSMELKELIAEAKQKDIKAMEELFIQFRPLLKSMVKKYLRKNRSVKRL